MLAKRISVLILIITLIQQNVICHENVNLVCTNVFVKMHASMTFFTCFSSSFVIESSNSVLEKVIHPNGSNFDTSNIECLNINTEGKTTVKFMPARIKMKFPKLTALDISRSGLTHVEKEDMRQFGGDLVLVDFFRNSLTALESDVFDYNPNLRIIFLSQNSFRFIDFGLFQNFRKMTNLRSVHFKSSTCIDEATDSSKTHEWGSNNCNDLSSKHKNLRRIHDRKQFSDEFALETQIILVMKESFALQNRELKDAIEKQQIEIASLKDALRLSHEKIEGLEKSLSVLF